MKCNDCKASMSSPSFEDIKPLLVKELEKIGASSGINEPFTIVNGFIEPIYYKNLSDEFKLWGANIPMIMLLGDSGQIYFFALKKLLPKLFEEEESTELHENNFSSSPK